MSKHTDLIADIKDTIDALADYVDIEDGTEGPKPNLAMRVTTDLERAIARAERSPDPVP